MKNTSIKFGYFLTGYSLLTIGLALVLGLAGKVFAIPDENLPFIVNAFFIGGGLSISILTFWMLGHSIFGKSVRNRWIWVVAILLTAYFGAVVCFLIEYRRKNSQNSKIQGVGA